MHILIVDDSKTARLQVKIALERAGHQVSEASSGQAALEWLLAGDAVGLIITDQNMPDKSGIEMLQELRAAKGNKNANTAAIFLSSDSSLELRTIAKSLGVKAFIAKPINPNRIVELVAKITGD